MASLRNTLKMRYKHAIYTRYSTGKDYSFSCRAWQRNGVKEFSAQSLNGFKSLPKQQKSVSECSQKGFPVLLIFCMTILMNLNCCLPVHLIPCIRILEELLSLIWYEMFKECGQ